jgi:hypothetical protein
VGYLLLVLAVGSYAVGILAQTVAAKRSEQRGGLDLGLLARLARDRAYLLGFGAQCVGFALAFLARADLPLYLVQAGTSSAAGLAAVMGVIVLGWRIRPAEIGVLVVMAAGLVLLVGAAEPGTARDLSALSAVGLSVALVVALLLAVPAGLVRGPRGAVPLGLLAGVGYAVVAIVSRSLAVKPLADLPFEPLTWLMIAAAVVGQGLLAAALQRGTATATVASMDSMTVLLASGVGLLVLGDLVAPGRTGWLLAGLLLVVAGVLTMAFVSGQGVPADRPDPVVKPSPPLRSVAQERS